MSTEHPRGTAGELVPLAERLRFMQLFRVTAAIVVVAFSLVMRGSDVAKLSLGTAGYLVASIAGEVVWRAFRRRGLFLFGAMLIVDGVYLAWAVSTTGGTMSPLRYLMLVHLIAVALLASYRTGLKLALWHSILLVAVYNLETGAVRDAVLPTVPGTEFQRLVLFIAAFWVVAISTACFSAVNERELRRRRYDLESLAALATDLETAGTPATVAALLTQRLVDTFGFSRCAVVAVHDGEVSVLAGTGDGPILLDAVARAGGLVTQLQSSRETLLVAGLDPDEDPDIAAVLPGVGNLVVVPLPAEGRTAAVLLAEHAMRSGSRIERRVVTAVERFSAHAALSLRNATLLDAMQQMASTDALTQIANRRTFEDTLRRELAGAAREGSTVSLILFDVDDFKRLNDTHGHQRGDEVLRELARALAVTCRAADTPARYGGEEFAVIAPRCSAAESYMLAERIRQAMSAVDGALRVTVSAGVASFPLHGRDADELVQAADAALYESKRQGRDRVTRAQAQPSAAPATADQA